ncbi:MAG: FAD-dependent oxidoreductase [Candidatus Kapabacteria bacterium]|nr:FAD-dependent oxidoreductase [Candidatus Kapabacteria bacterium]
MNTRRDFLYTIILGSGAVFLAPLPGCGPARTVDEAPPVTKIADPIHPRVGTPQFRVAHEFLRDGKPLPEPSTTVRRDVVVIGGGLSGLTAALVLQTNGVDSVLLESEPRLGGSAVSEKINTASVPLGSVYFVSRTEEIEMLIKATSIEPVQCPDDAYILRDGRIVQDLWSDSSLKGAIPDERDRDGMKRFRDVIAVMDADLPSYPLPKTLSPRMQELDAQSAANYIDRFASPTLEKIINAYSRSSMGAPSTGTNAYCLLNFYQSELGSSFGFSRYSFPGGTSRLATGVAAALENTKSAALVARVHETADDVQIDVVEADGTVTRYLSSFAVVAVPKYQLSRLLSDPGSHRLEALKKISYSPYATIQISSSIAIASGKAYDTWDLRVENSYTDVIDPMCIQPGATAHVVSLYVPLDPSQRSMLQDPEAFASFAAKTVEKFAAGLTEEQRLSIIDVHCWGWGHGIVVPTPKSHNGPAQTASVATARLRFAGTDSDCAPAIENATEQGARAARDIIAQLQQRSGR